MQEADNEVEPQRPRPLASLRRFKDPIHDFSELHNRSTVSLGNRDGVVPFSSEVCAIIDTYVPVVSAPFRLADGRQNREDRSSNGCVTSSNSGRRTMSGPARPTTGSSIA